MMYCVLCSNQWNQYADMYSELNNDSPGPRYYFALYYLLSIWVVLNIVVSFVMEIYARIQEDNEPKVEKLNNLHQVRKMAPKKDDLEKLIRDCPALQKPKRDTRSDVSLFAI